MDEGIVEGREDMSDSENLFTLCYLRTERDGGFFLGCFGFFGGLEGDHPKVNITIHHL